MAKSAEKESCIILTKSEYIGLIGETVKQTIRELDLKVLVDKARQQAVARFFNETNDYFRKTAITVGLGDRIVADSDQGVTCKIIKRRVSITANGLARQIEDFYLIFRRACYYQMAVLRHQSVAVFSRFQKHITDLQSEIRRGAHLNFMLRFLDGIAGWIDGLWPYETRIIVEHFIYHLDRFHDHQIHCGVNFPEPPVYSS